MDKWHYIKADRFFRELAPKIRNYKHKLRGKNGRGNPIEFTEQDNAQIVKGLEKLIRILKK